MRIIGSVIGGPPGAVTGSYFGGIVGAACGSWAGGIVGSTITIVAANLHNAQENAEKDAQQKI